MGSCWGWQCQLVLLEDISLGRVTSHQVEIYNNCCWVCQYYVTPLTPSRLTHGLTGGLYHHLLTAQSSPEKIILLSAKQTLLNCLSGAEEGDLRCIILKIVVCHDARQAGTRCRPTSLYCAQPVRPVVSTVHSTQYTTFLTNTSQHHQPLHTDQRHGMESPRQHVATPLRLLIWKVGLASLGWALDCWPRRAAQIKTQFERRAMAMLGLASCPVQ